MINFALKTFFLALLPSGSVILQLITGVPGSPPGNEELEFTLVDGGRPAKETEESAFLKGVGRDAIEKTVDFGWSVTAFAKCGEEEGRDNVEESIVVIGSKIVGVDAGLHDSPNTAELVAVLVVIGMLIGAWIETGIERGEGGGGVGVAAGVGTIFDEGAVTAMELTGGMEARSEKAKS